MIRILFVEDDLPLAMGIEYTLKKEGFEVIHSKNLEDARNKYSKAKFDLILLDVLLPDGNGYDFCRDVRKSSDIPIIFMTACDEEVNVILGLDMGGDDYVTKPIRIKELISRINAVLRRKGLNKDERKDDVKKEYIKSGNITIEILKVKVYKGSKSIDLTGIEYKLLLLLIKSKGNALTRVGLLENLWDIDGNFVDGNSLTVYIKRLREKIEDDIKTPCYIETVRGVGYRWAMEVSEE